jgi:Na+/proline symporter
VTGRFNLLDLLVLLLYLGGTTALGMWIGRTQRSTSDYFVADRAIPWWAVMFSIVASETSALTFISIPGLAYTGNLGFLEVVAGYIVGRIVVAYTLLPRYFAGNLVTAYALLETRFGLGTRRFTSIVFMITRAMADAVRVFATAIPVALIIGGISAIVLIGQAVDGGWTTILAQAGAAGKLQGIDWYTGFDRPHTMFAGIIGGAFLAMASHGTDQIIVQRLLSSRSLKQAQVAIIGSGFAVFAQMALFLMVGLGLWVVYGGQPFATADQIFPTFIIERMPHGLIGLIVAAIIAATMSTHSGAINALAASSTYDIYLPFTGRSADDPRTLRVSKLFALAWGIALTAGALMFKEQGTPVVVIALSIASFTQGGLLGGFFLGLFWSRAIQRDAILGMSVGISCMAFIVFAKQIVSAYPSMEPTLHGVASIAWPWYVLIGLSITFVTGAVSSFSHPAPAPPHVLQGNRS